MASDVIIEFLTIGDEIVDGRRIDTNTGWLGRKCTLLGAPPRYRQSMTDRMEDIAEAFQLALSRSDILISTGGLGPTSDDITFEALAKALNRKLEFHPEIFERIEKRFKEKGIHCPPQNRRQAMLPESSKEIVNDWGTAPGLVLLEKEKYIFVLPGVPEEMKNLFERGVAPVLQKVLEKENVRKEKIYSFVGIPESHLEELVGQMELDRFSDGDVRIAYTASHPQIDLTLSVASPKKGGVESILSQCDEKIRQKAGKFLVSENGVSVAEHVFSLLKNKRLTLSIAESFTGGLLASQLVDIPGSSAVFTFGAVTYSNESKVQNLGVSLETLKKFGAVSKECALEMAHGVRKKGNSDIGLSTTGIAGPDGGTAEKPVGLAYLAWVGPKFENVERYHFRWDRNRNRMLATFEAWKGLIGLIQH